MKRIKIIVLLLTCTFYITSQTFRDNYIGTYFCKYTYHQNSLIINGSKNIYVYKDPNNSNRIVIADSGWNPPPSYTVNLYSDSTFKDTILCSSGLCFYGKFHHLDSIFYHKVEYDDPPYYTEYFGIKTPSTGIKEFNAEVLLADAYPNPCSGKLTINVPEGIKVKKYYLVTIDGKELPLMKTDREFDVSVLPEGLYFLKVETDQGILTKKIVITVK